MKVTVVVAPGGAHTGATTYAGQVRSVLGSRYSVRVQATEDALPADTDLIHILDAKSVLGDTRFLTYPGPLVVDLHDAYWTGEPTYPAFDGWFRRRRWKQQRPRFQDLLERADRVIVHSEAMLGAMQPHRCRLAPLPIDPEATRSRRQRDPGAPLQVLFAGRDALRKGLPVLTEALRRYPGPIRLRVVGSDYPHLRIAARWWTRGLQVEHAGELDTAAMAAALNACDVLALPAYTEAFGLVVQEALVRGVPVVASRVGGLIEQLDAAEGAIGVPPGDPDALRDALQRMAEDETGWRARAARDRDRLLITRTPKVLLEALGEAYDEAMSHAELRA